MSPKCNQNTVLSAHKKDDSDTDMDTDAHYKRSNEKQKLAFGNHVLLIHRSNLKTECLLESFISSGAGIQEISSPFTF